eukprot:TRINITY_DN3152_c0_g1_i8.p4 TRINITY_DN3152_c0_g1~~TRINITY_DN3152_c0_g1_i8.p4  ORF type:complete len:103 (-),score=36.62 TRINITY_DN3152_c0_g1_i8:247-555(-)
MYKLKELMELVPFYIDLVAQTRLSPIHEQKAQRIRQGYLKALMSKKEDKQEEMEKRLEEKRQKDKEAFDLLSPEEQQKELARRRKREEKRKAKGGRVKLIFA